MESGESFPCPICRKPARPGSKEFPFCSGRCRLMDLGKWLSEEYRVSRPLRAEKGLEEKPEEEEDERPLQGGDADGG